jgi:hypothetical protein
MIRVFAQNYLSLGMEIESIRTELESIETLNEIKREDNEPPEMLTPEHKAELAGSLKKIHREAKFLGLNTSEKLIASALHDVPATSREYRLLVRAVEAELEGKTFVFIPEHAAKYFEFDDILSADAKEAFSNSYAEIRAAGNCFAAGLHTACVFHAMRASEIGLRAMAVSLEVSFPDKPIELAEWQNLLDQIDSKIVEKKKLPRSIEKDEELHFYSQASTQLRFFKDGWRVRVAHTRANYSEAQAKDVLDHVRSFFEILAKRFSEPSS